MPISELLVLAGGLNQTPTISLDTADSHSFGSDSTPTLLFTGTDADGDDLTYRIQIDTVNTFDSQGGGIDNALSLSDNGALYKTTDQKNNNIAFFCWIKRSADGSKDIFLNGNNGSYGEGYSFRLNSSDVLAIDLSYLAELASSFDLTGDTDWHFVGFQRRGTQWVIYLDDQEEVVGTTGPYGISASQKIVIGGKNSDGTVTYNFDGLIAKVGYWTRTLTDDEIAAFKRSGDPADVGDAVIDLPLNNSGAWGTNGGSGGNLSTDGTLTLSSSTFDAIEGVPLIDKKAAEVTKREYLTPNSNVVTTGWGAEGGPDYTSVDDPVGSPDEATTKVYTPSAGDLFSVGLTNSALSSEKITKVIAVLRVKASDPVANRVQAYLTISSTDYFSSDLYFSAQGIFHDLTAEWALNPATGLAWTVSDLNALVLGIKKIDSNGCHLTQMYVMVEYESSDAGFANEDTPADTALFNSGDQISFTVQAGDSLSDGTYYWRAIDKDTAGTDQWSAWPTTRSFTISSGGTEYTLTCTDSATMVDTINKATSRTFADAGILVDSMLKQLARGIVEVATMVDSIKKDHARTVSDAPVLVDSISKSTSRSISDVVTTVDSFVRSLSKTVVDTVTGVDLFSGIKVTTKVLSETVSIVDTLIKQAGKVLIDAVTVVGSLFSSFPYIIGANSNSGSSTTPSVTMPEALPGDLLMVIVSNNNANCADNNGAQATTEDGDYTGFSGGNAMAVYSRVVTGEEPSTLNYTLASSQRWAIIAFIVRNWNGTTIYDVSPSGGVSSKKTPSHIDCASATIGVNNALAIAVANIDGNANGSFNNPSSPSGWNDVKIENGQQPVVVGFKRVQAGATGVVSMTCTTTGGAGAGLNVFSIRPMSGTITSTITEAITIVDTVLKSTSRALSETVIIVDSIVRTYFRAFSETVTIVDNVTKMCSRVISESVSIVDTISAGLLSKMKKGETYLFSKIGRTVTMIKTRKRGILKTKGEDKTVLQ